MANESNGMSKSRDDDETMPSPPVSKTAALLTLVRAGDKKAVERLCLVYMPILKKWDHGRLPGICPERR
jgi:hypothetical protein